jgi:hypothetical protein
LSSLNWSTIGCVDNGAGWFVGGRVVAALTGVLGHCETVAYEVKYLDLGGRNLPVSATLVNTSVAGPLMSFMFPGELAQYLYPSFRTNSLLNIIPGCNGFGVDILTDTYQQPHRHRKD